MRFEINLDRKSDKQNQNTKKSNNKNINGNLKEVSSPKNVKLHAYSILWSYIYFPF